MVRWLSITSWRSPKLLMTAWAIAAAGMARMAPTAPRIAAPAIAEPKAMAGCRSIVRAVMRGSRK